MPRAEIPPLAAASAIDRAKRPEKLAETVARQIIRKISTRNIEPGTVLAKEVHMAQEYNVSRGTVREALRILEVQGLIYMKPGIGGGPCVNGVHSEEMGRMLTLYFNGYQATFADLIDARRAIESMAAKLASERRSADSAAELAEAAERAYGLIPEPTPQWLAASSDFHSAVLRACGTRVIDLLGRAIQDIYHGRLRDLPLDRPTSWRNDVHTAHSEIMDAITAGRGLEAQSLMDEHLRDFGERMMEQSPELANSIIEWM